MPALSNSREEMFCQNLANGMSQTDAYEAGGYARNPSAASQRAALPHIQQRVAEIIAEKDLITDKLGDDIDNLPSELNMEWLLKTLMKNVQIAQKSEQISAANKAIEMIGSLIGYSIKNPTAGAAKEATKGEEKTPEIDMDRMVDGMGKLGEILSRREDDKKKAEDNE